jgi:DNA-directed RNA polymerase
MLRRVEKTTWLLSRQALPRPARLHSTPTRRANAPALAAAEHSRNIEFPSFVVHRQAPAPRPKDENRILNDLERFLLRDRTYTVLPPPPPLDAPASVETWYTDTLTQESMSIMDACLHNLYDVPRAKIIFEQLRQNETKSLLETGVYNAFIEAYYGMAFQKDRENSGQWLDNIHDLYQILESEVENTAPNKVTYGLMLRIWQ